ncbi:MAG: hypothetical protein J0L99_04190 [Chitinophagales bacterium]|nr:hypothetical protein [Chitinophagales bacterium]
MQTSFKSIVFAFFLCFVTQENAFSQNCTVPPAPNLTPEGNFEAHDVPIGSTINAAFNNGYIPNWFSGNGTPSLCNAITHINNSQTINAFEGTDFACLSCSRDGSTCSENEMIFTNVYLCQGAKYRLNFAFHRIYVFEFWTA